MESLSYRWRPDQLMFIDESAANERTLDRKYQWSRIGTQCVVTEQLKSSKKWSILPVYTQDGYIGPVHTRTGNLDPRKFPRF